jgi:hypothetical protein
MHGKIVLRLPEGGEHRIGRLQNGVIFNAMSHPYFTAVRSVQVHGTWECELVSLGNPNYTGGCCVDTYAE